MVANVHSLNRHAFFINVVVVSVFDLVVLIMKTEVSCTKTLIKSAHRYDSSLIGVEEGISSDVIKKLRSMGHTVDGPVAGENRSRFGRGQIITRGPVFRGREGRKESHPTLWAGSDPRADGAAIGYCT